MKRGEDASKTQLKRSKKLLVKPKWKCARAYIVSDVDCLAHITSCNGESRTTHVTAAASALAFALPTPTPASRALVVKMPRRYELRA